MTYEELVKVAQQHAALAPEDYTRLMASAPGQDIHLQAIRTVAEATALRSCIALGLAYPPGFEPDGPIGDPKERG
jgi:hypothetical protein